MPNTLIKGQAVCPPRALLTKGAVLTDPGTGVKAESPGNECSITNAMEGRIQRKTILSGVGGGHRNTGAA